MNIHLDVFEHEVADARRKLIDEPVNYDLIDKNKYANNSEFVPDKVYRRLLNKITNFQWSFVPYSIEEDDNQVRFIGMLVVPGFGVHTGVGSVAKNKKDNSNALASAKTYAFKNACKEMGLAPNIGDKDFDEEIFENDIDEEEFDFTEEEKAPAPKSKETPKNSKTKKTTPESKTKTKPKAADSVDERIAEIREAYELEDDDEFIAFIQIWDADILELEDMEDDDWVEFLDYVEANKSKFEDF